MTGTCLEMVRFRLAADANADAFRAAAPAVTAWAARQQGFQYRTLAEDGKGGWVDMIWWASADDAEAAGAKFSAELGDTAFARMIDGQSVQMSHLPVAHMGMGA